MNYEIPKIQKYGCGEGFDCNGGQWVLVDGFSVKNENGERRQINEQKDQRSDDWPCAERPTAVAWIVVQHTLRLMDRPRWYDCTIRHPESILLLDTLAQGSRPPRTTYGSSLNWNELAIDPIDFPFSAMGAPRNCSARIAPIDFISSTNWPKNIRMMNTFEGCNFSGQHTQSAVVQSPSVHNFNGNFVCADEGAWKIKIKQQ